MIQRVMDEIQSAGGAITLTELSQKMQMERSALERIIAMLQRKKLLARHTQDDQLLSCPTCPTTKAKVCGCH